MTGCHATGVRRLPQSSWVAEYVPCGMPKDGLKNVWPNMQTWTAATSRGSKSALEIRP